jgi:hypothetical protein
MSVAVALRMRSGSGAQRLWVKPTIPHKCPHLFPLVEISLQIGPRSVLLRRTRRRKLFRTKSNPTPFYDAQSKVRLTLAAAQDHQSHADADQEHARPAPPRDLLAEKEFPA